MADKTPVSAALQWTGDSFAIAGDDMPPILTQALGAGAITFNGPELAVQTFGGPIDIGPGGWLIRTEEGLGAVTDEDFQANYEVITA